MFELFLTNTANLDTLRNFWNRGARFARHVGIRRGGQRIFSEWQKARERAGGGSMMSISFKTNFICIPFRGMNPQLADRTVSVSFRNDWQILAEFNAERRSREAHPLSCPKWLRD